jgi:hypothetical protein
MARTPARKRNFKRTQKLIHDLYKLHVAPALKNMAWDGTVNYQKVEHCHFFHSIDSKGIPQNTSASICGHFHVMEIVEPATETTPAVYKCSPPMQWVRSRNRMNGKWEKKLQLANRDDTHTHEVQYLDSHEHVPAKLNPEFIKLQQEVATPPPSVPGIEG